MNTERITRLLALQTLIGDTWTAAIRDDDMARIDAAQARARAVSAALAAAVTR